MKGREANIFSNMVGSILENGIEFKVMIIRMLNCMKKDIET